MTLRSPFIARDRWKRIGIAAVLAYGSAAGQTLPPQVSPLSATGLAETAGAQSGSDERPEVGTNALALLERGRAALRAGDRYLALAAIAQARRLQPDNAEIAQALADVLMELGAPSAAAQVLGPRIDLGVRSRVAGQRLRWAIDIPSLSPDPSHRFDDVDPALARLDALLVEAQAAASPDAGLITRLQRDRAVALRSRERWQETLEQVNVLRSAGDTLPVYVLEAEADALLALHRPAEARRVYEEAVQQLSPAERGDVDGPWRSLMTGLAYAQSESEDFNAAFATIDALMVAAGPPFRAAGKLQTPNANEAWLEAEEFDASMHSYADMPAVAWARMAPLARGAPALPWLRAQASDIEAQQG